MSDAVLLTGATRGLGLATVRALLRADPERHLILPVRGPAAAEPIVRQIGAGDVHLVPCDLADLASVRTPGRSRSW